MTTPATGLTVETVSSLVDAGAAVVFLGACIVLWRKLDAFITQRDLEATARAEQQKKDAEAQASKIEALNIERVSDIKEFHQTREKDLEETRTLAQKFGRLESKVEAMDSIEAVISQLVETVRKE